MRDSHTMKHVLMRSCRSGLEEPEIPGRREVAAWLASLGLTALWPVVASASEAASQPLAVIFPEIEEPYRSFFLNMVRGIEELWQAPVRTWPLSSEVSSDQVLSRVRQERVQTVVVLGRSGLTLASELAKVCQVVAGGVVSVPESEAQGLLVQSMAPDPALLFGALRGFKPSLRRIFVVQDPRQNAWLMRLARDAARQLGLELQVQEAQDLRTAARLYRDLLPRINGRSDALWLPQDTVTVEDSALVPLLLKEAWSQRFAVVSSNAAHVRRGALLALYPDNMDVGRELATLAGQAGAQGPSRGIQPMRRLRTAVNTRTASHLGLDLDASSQRIHLVLPEQ